MQKEKLTDAQRRLTEENIGLARMTAWKYRDACRRYGMDWDDTFSIACLGLMKAARKYNPELGRESTYLTCGCESAILTELRKCGSPAHTRFTTIPFADLCYADDEGREIPVADTLADPKPSPEALVLDAEIAQQLWKAIERSASPRHRRVLHLRMQGLNLRQIAQTVGISKSGVSYILSDSRKHAMEVLAP